MSQVQQLANYLANGYKATRLTVMNQLNIANVTAVVSDLRNSLGRDVVKTTKRIDSNNRSYAEYSISTEKLLFLREKGLLFHSPCTNRLYVRIPH